MHCLCTQNYKLLTVYNEYTFITNDNGQIIKYRFTKDDDSSKTCHLTN